MVQRLLQDNATWPRRSGPRAVCEKHHDVATSNLLETIIDESERRKWFLFEIAQGLNNTE